MERRREARSKEMQKRVAAKYLAAIPKQHGRARFPVPSNLGPGPRAEVNQLVRYSEAAAQTEKNARIDADANKPCLVPCIMRDGVRIIVPRGVKGETVNVLHDPKVQKIELVKPCPIRGTTFPRSYYGDERDAAFKGGKLLPPSKLTGRKAIPPPVHTPDYSLPKGTLTVPRKPHLTEPAPRLGGGKVTIPTAKTVNKASLPVWEKRAGKYAPVGRQSGKSEK